MIKSQKYRINYKARKQCDYICQNFLEVFVRYFTIIIFCSVYVFSFGQYAGRGAKDINSILSKNDSVLVVLSGDEKFDNNLVYSMENYWKIGPWDTISITRKKELLNIKSKQLILIFNIELIRESSNMINSRGGIGGMRTPYQNAKYQLEFGLIQRKDALKPFDINADPLVYDVLNYHGIEDKGIGMAYRLPITIFNIQNVLKLVTVNNVKKPVIDNFANINNKLEKMYCENAGLLKEKILLLNSDESKLMDEDDLKDYPYKYEFASSEKIGELIKEKNASYAFLHLAGHTHKYLTIYDLETYVPLYSFFNSTPSSWKLRPNVSKLIEAIKNSDATEIKHNYLMESKELNSQD